MPLALFLIALSVRVVYLWQAREIPTMRVLVSDSRSYYDWAGRIAGGEWWRGEVFYQAPLYPYFLALARLVTGDNLLGIRILQVILGALACVFLYRAGTRFSGRGAGVVAALMLALCGPAIFFDALIQKTVLDTFLLCALLACLGAALSEARLRIWLLAGLLTGLLSLTRENALVLGVIIPCWLLLHFRGESASARARRVAVFVLGLGLLLGLVGFRNYSVGGNFLITTAQLGPNLYFGNNPNSKGIYIPLRPGREDPAFERLDATEIAEAALKRKLTPREVSDFWVRKSLTYIREQPTHWVRLMVLKGLLVLNDAEVTDTEDYYVYEAEIPLLRGLGVAGRFGVVISLAAAGVWLCWPDRRRLSIVYLIVLSLFAATALFYVYARYRFPLVPPLLLVASAGLIRARAALRERAYSRLVGPVLVCLATGLVSALPLVPREVQKAGGWANFGAAAAVLGEFDQAIAYEERALRISPGLLQARYQLASALRAKGMSERAIEEYRRILELDPGNAEAMQALALLFEGLGRNSQAAELMEELVRRYPERSTPREVLIRLLLRGGRPEEVPRVLKSDSSIGHIDALTFFWTGRELWAQGAIAEALEALAAGHARFPDDADIANALAWYLATGPDPNLRDPERALAFAEDAVRLVGGDSPHMLDTRAAALAASGDYGAAAASARAAADLASYQGDSTLATAIRARETLYRSGKPFVER